MSELVYVRYILGRKNPVYYRFCQRNPGLYGWVNFERFRQDVKTIRAVELNFIIIGEAVKGIPDEVQDDHQ